MLSKIWSISIFFRRADPHPYFRDLIHIHIFEDLIRDESYVQPLLPPLSSAVMPVVESSIKGFGRKLSAATKPTSTIKHGELFGFADRGLKSALATGLSQKLSAVTKRALKHQKSLAHAAVHEQNRGLQEIDLTDPAVCEVFLTFLVGPDSGCTCTDEEPSTECIDYLATCKVCDTLQGEDACISISSTEATSSVVSGCITYESGPFDNVICETENSIDNTCTITIDGTECSSCTVIDCDGDTDYDIDCSNIIPGETWNLCTSRHCGGWQWNLPNPGNAKGPRLRELLATDQRQRRYW
jgi:hypothetical protein